MRIRVRISESKSDQAANSRRLHPNSDLGPTLTVDGRSSGANVCLEEPAKFHANQGALPCFGRINHALSGEQEDLASTTRFQQFPSGALEIWTGAFRAPDKHTKLSKVSLLVVVSLESARLIRMIQLARLACLAQR